MRGMLHVLFGANRWGKVMEPGCTRQGCNHGLLVSSCSTQVALVRRVLLRYVHRHDVLRELLLLKVVQSRRIEHFRSAFKALNECICVIDD